ncbi:uncharacterized protein LOC122968148 [Thunnus albacares]|uniref:uncharacterized protein LOC122968148 n=1 Tax=Thunnus albacares TaxID=8236 RepID=UPI001CF65D51|nr:uncharacterized protein LOC122968148 [Thunnus albacares]
MFAARTRAVVKSLGAQGDLIPNENVNEKIEMLTLVKARQKTFWPIIKYTIIDQTLLDLLEEQDFSPKFTEEVLTEDFKNLRDSYGGGCAAAGVDAPEVRLQVSAAVDTVDKASSITLKKKTVDIEKLRKSCCDKKIKKNMVDALKLKGTEKLTFVYQMVSNIVPVTISGKARKGGSVLAVGKIIPTLCVTGIKKEETSFTVPKDYTFAYGLMEITTKDETLGIPPRSRKVRHYNKGWWNISLDGDGEDCETLQKVKEEIKMKADLLQPLADLHESSRRDLLKTLSELLDDRDALTLLEETLDQSSKGVFERPQSQVVSSFMDLLDAAEASTSQKDAAHLLVSTMDTLPDGIPAILVNCSPETLRVLNQMVSSLKEDAQVKLPESLPVSLQEEGELRWAAELLCLTNQTLEELRDHWDRPEFSPEVMLELLCLVVQGLSMMQPETHS